MLSVSSIGSASGAADYFARDDYYTSGEPGERSEWGGRGAEELGLSGEVTKQDFEAILNGKLPAGDQVGDPKHRRIGMDMTFSMPKSASILSYVGGDERILDAHRDAVRETMSRTEKNFAEARSYERSKSGEAVQTGKLAYALFEHDTSRALDPQGHIHAVIANLTQTKEGNWQALHNDELWKNNTAIGAAYHATFNNKLQNLGYQTEQTGKHGQFEISGVPKNVISEFSQRRQTIINEAQKEGKFSPTDLNRITRETRDKKVHDENRAGLIEKWKERASALGLSGQRLVEKALGFAGKQLGKTGGFRDSALYKTFDLSQKALSNAQAQYDPLVDQSSPLRGSTDLITQRAVASAVRILSENEAAFTPEKLIHAALSLGQKGVVVGSVEKRVTQLVKDGRLIPGQSARIDGKTTHLTTRDELVREQSILNGIERGRGQAAPIIEPSDVTRRLTEKSEFPLNDGQLAAASMALSSEDKILAVQGVAGAGKSTMLQSLSRVAEDEGKTVIGLAYQNKMVGDLARGAGIKAQTVSSFVHEHIKEALAGKNSQKLKDTILVVDESSMVGNRPMENLIKISENLGADHLAFSVSRLE